MRHVLRPLLLTISTVAITVSVAHRFMFDSRRPVRGAAANVVRTGEEALLLFIGNAACGASMTPALPAAFHRIRDSLQATARQQGITLVTMGVSTDWGIEEGLAFLRPFGVFDEVVVGRNWLNSAVVRYVWRDLPGQSSIPQLVLVGRRVVVGGGGIQVSEERVVARRIGADDILAWQPGRRVLAPRDSVSEAGRPAS